MQIRSWRRACAAGFSMIEALVAIFVTLIVMSTLFGFLARGARTSTVEMDRADLQAQARHALDQMSRDVLLAGYGLPPEFPAFGTRTSTIGTDARSGSQRIEMVGMSGELVGVEPVAVESFDGRTARLVEVPPHLALGQPVLLYDDLPIEGSWVFGLVSGIRTTPVFEVEIVTEVGTAVTSPAGAVSLPVDVERYNRIVDGLPESGYLTPVSVIAYELDDEGPDAIPTLVRQLNWGEPTHVAHLESMEIRYFVGGTVSGPVIQTAPPPQLGFRKAAGNRPPDPEGSEVELVDPPVPQPDPRLALDAGNVVQGVRISLTGRSRHANLVGSTVKPDQSADEEGFVRQTLTTRVATRNLLSRAELRMHEQDAERAETRPRGRN